MECDAILRVCAHMRGEGFIGGAACRCRRRRSSPDVPAHKLSAHKLDRSVVARSDAALVGPQEVLIS